MWRRVTTALWFLPATLIAAAAVAAVVLVLIDPTTGALRQLSPRFFAISPDGARSALTAIATAMLSVAGLVFTITITTLSLSSQQFTSRVLRTFIRDRGNQLVLGVFLGAFVYSVIVLRSVQNPDEGEGFVPELAVLGAIGFALLGAALLIYFINHTATSIQASSIIARVSRQTIAVLAKLREEESVPPAAEATWMNAEASQTVRATRSGYVTAISIAAIGRSMETAGRRGRLDVRVGSFVVRGESLLSVLAEPSPSPPLPAEDIDRVTRAIAISRAPDIDDDPSFGIRQLVDIALRALSPSTNDTTTAVNCVDYLGAVLLEAARHTAGNAVWRGDDGITRVFLRRPGFPVLLNEAMEQIRESATDNLAVLRRQLMMTSRLEERVEDEEWRKCLLLQAQRVLAAGERGLKTPEQRSSLTELGDQLLRSLEPSTPTS